jgi:prepilin-type N-terminal cleavage/methylation domain-containing protein
VQSSARGFTLVEMMIAMVLTLILVFAIAEFYAIVGDAVKDGRATIEMGGQLRAVVQRLKADFDQMTVAATPWVDEGAASGYFEYFEGRGNDWQPDANNMTTITPPAGGGWTGLDGVGLVTAGVTNGLGDGDDFLAFTIRAAGQPFTGRYNGTIINSQLAEVIWWVAFQDDNVNGVQGVWDPGEPRRLYRRQLLIRPDLTNIDNNTTYSTLQAAHQRLLRLLQDNDISLRIKPEFTGPNPTDVQYRIVPNSLADLARRENRFGHMPLQVDTSRPSPPTPQYLIDQAFPHSAVTLPAFAGFRLLLPSFTADTPRFSGQTPYNLALETYVLTGQAAGEDLMLSNLLAFDVQAYDPYARVWPDNPGGNSQTALIPSDPGYWSLMSSPASLTANTLLGLGAYVDLGYYYYNRPAVNPPAEPPAKTLDNTLFSVSGFPMPYYADPPQVPPGVARATYWNNFGYNTYPFGATYDTWALSYEKDGMDQLNTGISPPRFDWATDGLDNDSANGVDDTGERETVPPYPQPLRGLRVRIRIYEPSTRQIRQATVETDFLRE